MVANIKFNTDSQYGESFEEKAVEDIKRLLGEDLVRGIKRIPYKENPQKQIAGIDIEVQLKAYPRIINVQVKSRRNITHDFVFAIEKHGEEWELKPTEAEFYAYYITDKVTPYILHYAALAMIFKNHYKELVATRKQSREKNEDFIIVTPEQLHKWNVEVGKGKNSMIDNLLGLRAEAQGYLRQ